MSDAFPGIHVVGDGKSWFEAVGAVHDKRAVRDALAKQREEVLCRLRKYMVGVNNESLLRLLREVETMVVRDDNAVVQLIALQGMRPSEGLFVKMEALVIAEMAAYIARS